MNKRITALLSSKTFISHAKNGFSLIELMISVSLISILAMIGIPSYDKFRAKAYMAEYTGYLAAIRTAETSFFTEYSGYHSSFRVIGFLPLGNVYANEIGFHSAGTVPPEGPPVDSYYSVRGLCGYAGSGCRMMVPFNLAFPAFTQINDPTATVNISTYKVGVTFLDERNGEGGCTIDPSSHGAAILNTWFLDQTGITSKSRDVISY